MKTFTSALLVTAAMATAATAQDWTQSQWGPDDEIGAANRIAAESVLAASQVITEGKTYSIGIVVDRNVPAFAPRSMSLTILQPNQVETQGLGHNHMTYNDNIFTGWLGIGPQIDGLGSVDIHLELMRAEHRQIMAA